MEVTIEFLLIETRGLRDSTNFSYSGFQKKSAAEHIEDYRPIALSNANVPWGTLKLIFQYADDTVFYWGAVEAVMRIAILVHILATSQAYRSTTTDLHLSCLAWSREIVSCGTALGTATSTLPFTYLGLPLSDRKILFRDWAPVVEKSWNKAGWLEIQDPFTQ